MNKNIVEFYGIAANCNIAKEEAAELIHAIRSGNEQRSLMGTTRRTQRQRMHGASSLAVEWLLRRKR